MIIGISGKANSGKNQLADYICALDGRYEEHAFAGKLKQIAALLTGRRDQTTREGKACYMPEWKMTVGEFQQKLGTEAIRRGIREDAWIIALFQDYEPDDHWVITDVRFPNEAMAIQERGGILIRVNRDSTDDCGRDIQHVSETALDNWPDWDFVYENNGSLSELFEWAKGIVRYLDDNSL